MRGHCGPLIQVLYEIDTFENYSEVSVAFGSFEGSHWGPALELSLAKQDICSVVSRDLTTAACLSSGFAKGGGEVSGTFRKLTCICVLKFSPAAGQEKCIQ